MRGGHQLPTVCREWGDRRCADKSGYAGNEHRLRHWRSPEPPNINPVAAVSADQSERDAEWEIGTQAIVTELPPPEPKTPANASRSKRRMYGCLRGYSRFECNNRTFGEPSYRINLQRSTQWHTADLFELGVNRRA